MLRLTFVLLSSLLLASPPVWSAGPGAKPRPLNLSLPRDIVDAPGPAPADETVERNLQAPPAAAPAPGRHLPYGAGYEHRLQQFEYGGGAATGAAGGGGGSGGGGSGGRRGR